MLKIKYVKLCEVIKRYLNKIIIDYNIYKVGETMNIKSKKMKTRNIPNNHQVIDQLTNKPYHLLVLALLMGVFIMYFNIYVGLFFVIFAIFMLILMIGSVLVSTLAYVLG